MKKEIQAAEWLLILAGLILLIRGSENFEIFNRIFQVYYFLFTFGIGAWMAVRYFKRYNKKNIVVFHLNRKDKLTGTMLMKSLQLLVIVFFGIIYSKETWMFVPTILSILFFIILLGRNGRPKLVFHHPDLFMDSIFFENIKPLSLRREKEGIRIRREEEEEFIRFDELDAVKFKREIEFEENQLLDDVMLTDGENEVIRVFINEVHQFAEKTGIPFHQSSVGETTDTNNTITNTNNLFIPDSKTDRIV